MSGHPKELRIVIAAEPLQNGAGLAMFLLDTVVLFAQTRPDWQFTLLALSDFSDASLLERYPNVKVIFCDRLGWRGYLSKAWPKFRGREKLFDLLAERSPSSFLKRQFGNLSQVWEGLDRCDAVWVPHFAISQDRWPALYRPGVIRSPVLLTIHDLHPAAFPEEWRDKPEMLDNFWKVFKPFAQKAEAIITHSNFQKQAIVDHFDLDPSKVSVAYLPLPQNELLTREYSEQETAGVLGEFQIIRPYIFCPMSQVAVHKNHRRAIDAWVLLRRELGDQTPQLVFTNSGHPGDRQGFERYIRQRGLEGKVMFTGIISREKLAILYRSCQALLSPTLYEGGGSGPVMEAVMAGRPVLCSDIPPIREQMGRFGLTARYFDAHNHEEIARAVRDFLKNSDNSPLNDPNAIKQRLPGDREELAKIYTEAFLRITGNK